MQNHESDPDKSASIWNGINTKDEKNLERQFQSQNRNIYAPAVANQLEKLFILTLLMLFFELRTSGRMPNLPSGYRW